MDILKNSLNSRGCRSFFLVSITLTLFACGGSGGGDDPGDTQQIVLTDDQAAFERTVFPVLRANCSTCHSETGNFDPKLAQFASNDVVVAHSVVISRGLVNFESPSSSRFVARLNGGHNCGTTCADDAITMTAEISKWGGSGGTEPPPVVVPPPPGTTVSSTEAFHQTLHPKLIESCSGSTCHSDNGSASAKFAGTDLQLAHDLAEERVVFSVPADSKLVTFLSVNRHNCGTPENCDVLATQTENLIKDWQNAIVTGKNTPPKATNDNFTTTVDTPLTTGSVLVNDRDDDNDILGISAFDADSTQSGTVIDNLNGTFTYTPASGFTGVDTFSYTVSDGQGGSGSATVSISVNAIVAPIANNDLIKTNQNTPVIINALQDLLANDISASGNALSVISVDNRSANNANIVFDTANGAITYTPLTGFSGLDSFSYTVSDGIANATGQVEVDVNSSPVAVSDAVYTYVNISANTGSVIVNDRDSNGDPLTVSLQGNAQIGEALINPDGTSFTYIPAADFVGNDEFNYIVSDGRGGTALATVFISVVEPVLADDNRFLAFLNQSAEVFTESAETATAYYTAVDPGNQRTNLEDWRELNGFNLGADAATIYVNNNDLQFSRRMFVRTDPITGVISSYVENYANLADAQNEVNVIATVAMEYTVAPGRDPLDLEAPKYMTFYGFGGDDNRILAADLDGRGAKFIPGLCNTCHGGGPKALEGGIYPDDGDTGAQFIPWDLDTFLFEDVDANGVVTVVDRDEDAFKVFNETTLRTDPKPAVKEIIEGWYGGPGLPANAFNGNFVPNGWSGNSELYLRVVRQACRSCHIVQGSPLQNDIDFASYDKFMGYKARIETLVFDESTMPLARRTWDLFWADPAIPERMAELMGSSKFLKDGNVEDVLSPGRSVANAGPSFREAAFAQVDLNGNGSVFTGGADEFLWTLVERPAGSNAVLQNANQADAFFLPDEQGDYVVQLVVNDGLAATSSSPPAEAVIRVSAETLGASFVSDVKPIFDICAVCHLGLDNPDFGNARTLYDNLVDFVNADDPINSRILTKPSGQHHGGGIITGFESVEGENYKTMLRWILEGALDN